MIDASMFTFKMTSLNKTRFVNISKSMYGTSSVICFTDTKFENSQFIIENYSKNISMKLCQKNFHQEDLFLDICSKSIFTFNDKI